MPKLDFKPQKWKLIMFNKIKKIISVAVLLTASLTSNAALISFDISYDDTFGGGMEGAIIGTGTFTYEGNLTLGETLLSDLTNMSYFSDINGILSTTADIITPLNLVSIFIFEDLGTTYATFIGNTSGSLDFSNSLTHEPGLIGAPCCGGTDISRLYQIAGASGNFQMVLANQVSEPAGIVFIGISMLAWGIRRRKA